MTQGPQMHQPDTSVQVEVLQVTDIPSKIGAKGQAHSPVHDGTIMQPLRTAYGFHRETVWADSDLVEEVPR